MDLSASPGLLKASGLARQQLCHAHYLAASRVSSLEGLQIINLNEQMITVDKNVGEFLADMHKNPLQLCYTPTYHLPENTVVTYLNTVSLHRYFDDIYQNHNIIGSSVLMFSETRLTIHDKTEQYILPSFHGPYRNDQKWNTSI